jgi:hypothetical protein
VSIEAMKWAVEYAPPMPSQLVATLTGLAYHADKRGRGAYPSVPRLAAFTCKDRRSVQRDLKQLRELKLIRLGDQSLAAHLPAGKRPEVYDLALESTVRGGRAAPDEVTSTSRVTLASSRRRGGHRRASSGPESVDVRGDVDATGDADVTGDVDVADGVTSTSQKGWRGRHPNLKEEPSVEPKDCGAQPTGEPLLLELVHPADTAKPRRASKPRKPSKHEKADQLTAAFWERYKTGTAQSFIAIRGIVRTALGNGLDRDDVARALDLLGREGRNVSGGTINVALQQIRTRRGQALAATGTDGAIRSTTDDRVAGALALAAELYALEQQGAQE